MASFGSQFLRRRGRANWFDSHLILPGKLEEARQILGANWRLNALPHANTTPRLAFLRHLISLLESLPGSGVPSPTGLVTRTMI